MKLCFTAEYAGLAAALTHQGMSACPWEAERFANGEWHLTLQASVRGAPCVVLAAITPPDARLLTTLLLCHTLKKEGAARVTALLPYLAYTRQDKEEAGKSRATAWLGAMLPVSGVDELITVDIHSERAQALLAVPARSLSPAPLWAQEIARLGWHDATLVAPDHGALVRCEAVRQAAGMASPCVWFEKHRTPAGVQATIQGQAGARAIIIDDILDTGGTLLACCEGLLAGGTREILVMVTHGLFTGSAWQRLWTLGVQHIYCTDTVPLPAALATAPITQRSVAALLATGIAPRTREEDADGDTTT